MTPTEYYDLHPLEQRFAVGLGVALERDRRDYHASLIKALAKALSG